MTSGDSGRLVKAICINRNEVPRKRVLAATDRYTPTGGSKKCQVGANGFKRRSGQRSPFEGDAAGPLRRYGLHVGI